ncbi:tRNA pseudouridine synthase A [Rubripirellula lacrimiformis]|uniref:tRNA pseudouridine synthase A n=1 Tax=Rubripirellula lacrimiformis TaxID=1930273 RepID=A0A517N5Z5_9BACT|nr:tRNA pseudouridine synthase A [Rubripirellula lacrimiformis]QDT02544.1 tRNA pseudouridine synthase A [Rubripirellula lacrimiformis]
MASFAAQGYFFSRRIRRLTGTYKLTIAYDGGSFAGWQVQSDRKTVQECLQNAIAKIAGQRCNVVGSGRTDAGVHAIAQVASVRIPTWSHSPQTLARAINVHLPDTIVVTQAQTAVDGFHAIRDATGKRYRYQLQVGGPRDVFQYRYRWHLHTAIDVEAMRTAARRMVGEHDFASFQASGSDRKTTVRDVRACDVIIQDSPGIESPGIDSPEIDDRETPDAQVYGGRPEQPALNLAIEVEANGFLYNMVRNIVGTLVAVGRGKYPPEWVADVFAALDRSAAGQTAPAHGLFLLNVDYPSSILTDWHPTASHPS